MNVTRINYVNEHLFAASQDTKWWVALIADGLSNERVIERLISIQPENMSLKDYGKLLMDGELKLKAHSDYKTKNRCPSSRWTRARTGGATIV